MSLEKDKRGKGGTAADTAMTVLGVPGKGPGCGVR